VAHYVPGHDTGSPDPCRPKVGVGYRELTVFPVFRRELGTLPPPPLIKVPSDHPSMFAKEGPVGDTPKHPNPPATYSDEEDEVPRPVSSGVDSTSCSLL
jgi:hypothetical protein